MLTAQLKKYGTTIKSATEPIADDSTGKLMGHILSVFAQFDNNVRTVAGMKAALVSGQWTFGIPVGYCRKVDTAGRDNRARFCKWPVGGQAVELYATGLHKSRRLTAVGLRTRGGNKLTPQNFSAIVRKPNLCRPSFGSKLSNRQLNQILNCWYHRIYLNGFRSVVDGRALTVSPHK